jgi:hypothetical protein
MCQIKEDKITSERDLKKPNESEHFGFNLKAILHATALQLFLAAEGDSSMHDTQCTTDYMTKLMTIFSAEHNFCGAKIIIARMSKNWCIC